MSILQTQITATVLMVRPKNFGFNPETAADNAFQANDESVSVAEIQQAALQEFDQMVSMLREKGVSVQVVEDTEIPLKTDAVFPNNWFSTHSDSIITYPMLATIRRQERRLDMVQMLINERNYAQHISLEGLEKTATFLEGTGSLILDRIEKLAYAAVSQRTHQSALESFCTLTGFKPVTFHSTDASGLAIYHTNVMMTLGTTFAIVALESIRDEAEREALIQCLEKTGKEIIAITMEQVNAFAGNMLQVDTSGEGSILVMSEQAFQALNAKQIQRIQAHCEPVSIPVYTIEKYGGGSVRCMIAEVF